MTDNPVRPNEPDDDGREPEEEEEGLQADRGTGGGAPAVDDGGGRVGLQVVGVGGGVGAAVEGGRVDQHLHGLEKRKEKSLRLILFSCFAIANLPHSWPASAAW